jgi:hypothetical protein
MFGKYLLDSGWARLETGVPYTDHRTARYVKTHSLFSQA